VLYHDDGSVKGIATGDMGVEKNGEPGPNYQPGIELHARQTVFSEGCRGSLTKGLFSKFNLREGVDPQTYGIGIKELWEVRPEVHQQGLTMHTVGWPVSSDVYGGSFLYHLENNQVAVGFVVGPGLQQPASVALRGIPALQDPSGDPQVLRGRPAHCLWRPGPQ
jgi:electron-transferring-flavoprotein dehydrogenase